MIQTKYNVSGALSLYHRGRKLEDLTVTLVETLVPGDTLLVLTDKTKMVAAGGFGEGGSGQGLNNKGVFGGGASGMGGRIIDGVPYGGDGCGGDASGTTGIAGIGYGGPANGGRSGGSAVGGNGAGGAVEFVDSYHDDDRKAVVGWKNGHEKTATFWKKL